MSAVARALRYTGEFVLGVAIWIAFCVFIYLVLELQFEPWDLLGL